MEEVKKEIQPYVGKIMNAVTNTGTIFAQLLGKGLEDGYKVHAVKVSKKVPFEEALKHFQNITKSKKSYNTLMYLLQEKIEDWRAFLEGCPHGILTVIIQI
jgi:hypothetical protein